MSSISSPQNNLTATWGELFLGGNALRSFTLVGGVILYAINMYIVTTILPNIVKDIGGLAYFSWNTTIFIVSSIIGSAITSKMMSKFGPKVAYLSALLLFLIGSIWCALAFSMWFLLIGRALQGLGGGMLFALGYSLIRIVFEPRLWTRATALVSGMWGIATLLGPAIGGIFAQSGHWRWAFWSLLPIIALLAIVVSNQIAGKPSHSSSKMESKETTKLPIMALSLIVLSVTFISLSSLKDSLSWTLTCLGIGLLLLIVMIITDLRSQHKLLPTGAYSLSTPLGKAYFVMLLLTFGITTEIYVPYFLQIIHNMQPLTAGYMTAIMAAGWTLSAIPSAAQTDKSRRILMQIAPMIVTISLITLALTFSLPSNGDFALLITYGFALLGVGFGIGLIWPHLLNLIFISAAKGEEALTSSSVTTVQLYATALAAALSGLVVNQAGIVNVGGIIGAQLASNWLFAIFAIAPFIAIIIVYRIIKLPALKNT